MNKNMFQKVIRQTDIKLDFSDSKELLPNSLKFVFANNLYTAFYIDENSSSHLIIETDLEKSMYKEILKYLGIKIGHNGQIMKNNENPRKKQGR